MKTYLVTGCAGFIGSNLAERLLKDGHTVIGVDDMSTGLQENLDLLKSFNLQETGVFKFLNTDISNGDFVKTFIQYLDDYYTASLIFPSAKIQCVFHMAALARIQPAIQNPTECLNRNVLGLMNVLELMRLLKIENIIFSSSSSVYGLKNKDNLPLKEDYEPDCLNQYSWSKYAGEQLIKVYCNLYGVNGISLRYFNVFGPREVLNCGEYSPVLGLFYQQVLKDKQPMTIVGDGEQTRDMTHVFDVVDANLKAAKQCIEGIKSRFHGEVFNIGTGQDISILGLVESIKSLLRQDGIKSSCVHIDARPGEAQATRADISRAEKFLGWKPQISFSDGLLRQKKYYLEKYGY
ncbi:MAG: SDR family NAD(P)-dependent oxidoreductase [Candidatus Parcubacteria bacterium]|nr:SDR family NAD(P)-dependent oxidoreductase [Candidatus Parcubacteria bacterium]